jgi:hypothetical protein
MAVYGSNSLAVRTQRNVLDAPLPENKSEAMPAHQPMVGSYMPGGKETPLPGRRYPKGMRNQPWKSWLNRSKPGIRRRRKRSAVASLMG